MCTWSQGPIKSDSNVSTEHHRLYAFVTLRGNVSSNLNLAPLHCMLILKQETLCIHKICSPLPISKISGKWIRILWLKIAFKPTSSVIKIVVFIGLNNRIRARPAIRFLADEQIYIVMSSIQLFDTVLFQTCPLFKKCQNLSACLHYINYSPKNTSLNHIVIEPVSYKYNKKPNLFLTGVRTQKSVFFY